MGRKRTKVVVTVTETWTFIFDETGETPDLTPLLELPALASIPTPQMDAAPLVAESPDAPAGDAPPCSNAVADGA
jgi:hypothetical protein